MALSGWLPLGYAFSLDLKFDNIIKVSDEAFIWGVVENYVHLTEKIYWAGDDWVQHVLQMGQVCGLGPQG